MNIPATSVDGIQRSTRVAGKAARRAVVCTVIGNSLEWFDFAVYAYFSTIIAGHFFSQTDHATALIKTFAVYGIGFVSRPLGAIFFGRLGDMKGRKVALLVALPMMGLGTAAIGFLPTYSMIGIAAPILLVACRLIQGFSTGGEGGNAIAYLLEWAPSNRRALYSSFTHATSILGTLLGSGLAAILSTALTQNSLEVWGWRVPFLVGGLIIAPLGYYLRSQMEETPRFEEVKRHDDSTSSPSTATAFSPWVCGLLSLGILGAWFVSYYVLLVYVPVFVTVHGHISRANALWMTSAGFTVEIASIIGSAYVSDRIGRKPLLIFGSVSLVVFSYPMFLLFLNSSHVLAIGIVICLCGGLIGIFAGTCTALIAELFPTRLRTTGVSIAYGLGAAIFGGFAPMISESLVKVSGSPISPSYFVIFAALITLASILSVKETAHRPLR